MAVSWTFAPATLATPDAGKKGQALRLAVTNFRNSPHPGKQSLAAPGTSPQSSDARTVRPWFVKPAVCTTTNLPPSPKLAPGAPGGKEFRCLAVPDNLSTTALANPEAGKKGWPLPGGYRLPQPGKPALAVP